jgi:hypothetical protein
VLPFDSWREVPNFSIDPLCMVKQGYIDDTGCLIKKQCVTHDQSLPGPSGLSVNKHVVASSMMACMFGLRLKLDSKSAYRRAHLIGQTSLESIIQVNGLLVTFLCMLFGGKPCPSQLSDISEMACDLTNALIQDATCPPSSLRYDLSDLLSDPERIDDPIPFS